MRNIFSKNYHYFRDVTYITNTYLHNSQDILISDHEGLVRDTRLQETDNEITEDRSEFM